MPVGRAGSIDQPHRSCSTVFALLERYKLAGPGWVPSKPSVQATQRGQRPHAPRDELRFTRTKRLRPRQHTRPADLAHRPYVPKHVAWCLTCASAHLRPRSRIRHPKRTIHHEPRTRSLPRPFSSAASGLSCSSMSLSVWGSSHEDVHTARCASECTTGRLLLRGQHARTRATKPVV